MCKFLKCVYNIFILIMKYFQTTAPSSSVIQSSMINTSSSNFLEGSFSQPSSSFGETSYFNNLLTNPTSLTESKFEKEQNLSSLSMITSCAKPMINNTQSQSGTLVQIIRPVISSPQKNLPPPTSLPQKIELQKASSFLAPQLTIGSLNANLKENFLPNNLTSSLSNTKIKDNIESYNDSSIKYSSKFYKSRNK